MTIKVDWPAYAHVHKQGKQGLTEYLAGYYPPTARTAPAWICSKARTTRPTTSTCARSPISTRKFAERDKDEMRAPIKANNVEYWRLHDLMRRAILDGHFPRANYIVSLSW